MSENDQKREWEKSVEELTNYLNDQSEAYNIRTHKGTVDFTIGDPELWPSYFNEDELNIIQSSSVSFNTWGVESEGKAVQGNPQTGSNIHLPPATTELWKTLQKESSFPDKFSMVNGTFALGGLLPPPDGVCTPHIMVIDNADVDEVIDAIEEALRLYHSVYDLGGRIIKEQPPLDDIQDIGGDS